MTWGSYSILKVHKIRMPYGNFRLLCSFVEWWACDKSVSPRCCAWLWPHLKEPPARELGWSETFSDLPLPHRPPWSLHKPLYQTGWGLRHSNSWRPSSSRSSRPPAPWCRSHSGKSEGDSRKTQSRDVFSHLYSDGFIQSTFTTSWCRYSALVRCSSRSLALAFLPSGGFFCRCDRSALKDSSIPEWDCSWRSCAAYKDRGVHANVFVRQILLQGKVKEIPVDEVKKWNKRFTAQKLLLEICISGLTVILATLVTCNV